MGGSVQLLCRACLLLTLLSAAAAGELRLFLVPQGQDPTNFPARPVALAPRTLESFTLEIHPQGHFVLSLVGLFEDSTLGRSNTTDVLHEVPLRPLRFSVFAAGPRTVSGASCPCAFPI